MFCRYLLRRLYSFAKGCEIGEEIHRENEDTTYSWQRMLSTVITLETAREAVPRTVKELSIRQMMDLA